MNSNCQVKIIIERIKEECHCNKQDIVDLTDMQAVVQKLTDQPDEAYATDILQPRGNYVLVKVKRRVDENGQFCNEYIPLLFGLDTLNPEYLSRLCSRKVNPDAYCKETKDILRNIPKSRGRNESRNSTYGKSRASNVLPIQLPARKASQQKPFQD